MEDLEHRIQISIMNIYSDFYANLFDPYNGEYLKCFENHYIDLQEVRNIFDTCNGEDVHCFENQNIDA